MTNQTKLSIQHSSKTYLFIWQMSSVLQYHILMCVQASRISLHDIFVKMYAKYSLRLVVMMALATTGMIGIDEVSYYYDKL